MAKAKKRKTRAPGGDVPERIAAALERLAPGALANNPPVVGDAFVPAEISPFGHPVLAHGHERATALRSWDRLRVCAGLAESTG